VARIFDRSRLRIEPLSSRKHDLTIGSISELKPFAGDILPAIARTAGKILEARRDGAAVIFIMGAHTIRSGVASYIIDLMEKGFITLVATNGAGVIHDYELALIGATTESVARYISEGQFGLWQETGLINDIVSEGHKAGLGVGEAVGRAIEKGIFAHRETSVLAAGYRLDVPVTAHVGIGYDIVYEHPNCDGAAWGGASYADFLKFVSETEKLEGGVVMNFGSSVMGPEVYLKALAMARNAAHTEGRSIRRLTTLVCDLHPIEGDIKKEPDKSDPYYYFRPWKTMLARTVADGGESHYAQGRHEETVPMLWTQINRLAG
jgi:hypothetical protein